MIFAFSLGFGTTIAEPALIAVADKAAEIASIGKAIADTEEARSSYASGLRLTVALSVFYLLSKTNNIEHIDGVHYSNRLRDPH